MKRRLLILFVTIISALNSCRKPQDTPPLQSIITQGVWRVSVFKDNGNNLTYLYTGWQFRFKADKTVEVTNGVDTYNGTWEENTRSDVFDLNLSTPELELIYISQLWYNQLLTYGQVNFIDDKINTKKQLQFTRL